MGHSQTSTDAEERTSNQDTMDSVLTSATPEPEMEKEPESGEVSVSNVSTPDDSRCQMDKTPETPSNLTERKVSDKKAGDEGEIDVMDIPPFVDIVWRNVFLFIYLHILSAYGLYLLVTGQVMWQTIIWSKFVRLLNKCLNYTSISCLIDCGF